MTRSIAATQTSARTASGSDLWCTPAEVLERVRRIAPIGFDPCTNYDNPTGAKEFCAEAGGLTATWRLPPPFVSAMLVYVNPPYSEASRWADKVVHEAGLGAEVVTLVAARPDSRWFYRLAWDSAQAVCFWKGRLRFVGAPSSAPFPSCLVYHGPRPWAFESAFHDAGKVIRLR